MRSPPLALTMVPSAVNAAHRVLRRPFRAAASGAAGLRRLTSPPANPTTSAFRAAAREKVPSVGLGRLDSVIGAIPSLAALCGCAVAVYDRGGGQDAGSRRTSNLPRRIRNREPQHNRIAVVPAPVRPDHRH